ncbi:hypothetical protein LINGRAHAP2_LOCUS19498 [Linum grandiflorum]
MAAGLLRHHPLPPRLPPPAPCLLLRRGHVTLPTLSFRGRVPVVRASGGNSDFDRFARKAWRSANDGFELFLFEAKKTVERIDRKYSVGKRLSVVTQSAVDRARLIDRDLNLTTRWRAFSMDFSRNWPRVSAPSRNPFISFLLMFVCLSFCTLVNILRVDSFIAVQEAAQRLDEYSIGKSFLCIVLPLVCSIRMAVSVSHIWFVCSAACWASYHSRYWE